MGQFKLLSKWPRPLAQSVHISTNSKPWKQNLFQRLLNITKADAPPAQPAAQAAVPSHKPVTKSDSNMYGEVLLNLHYKYVVEGVDVLSRPQTPDMQKNSDRTSKAVRKPAKPTMKSGQITKYLRQSKTTAEVMECFDTLFYSGDLKFSAAQAILTHPLVRGDEVFTILSKLNSPASQNTYLGLSGWTTKNKTDFAVLTAYKFFKLGMQQQAKSIIYGNFDSIWIPALEDNQISPRAERALFRATLLLNKRAMLNGEEKNFILSRLLGQWKRDLLSLSPSNERTTSIIRSVCNLWSSVLSINRVSEAYLVAQYALDLSLEDGRSALTREQRLLLTVSNKLFPEADYNSVELSPVDIGKLRPLLKQIDDLLMHQSRNDAAIVSGLLRLAGDVVGWKSDTAQFIVGAVNEYISVLPPGSQKAYLRKIAQDTVIERGLHDAGGRSNHESGKAELSHGVLV